MLSIILNVCQSSVYLSWKSVYLGLLPTLGLSFLVFSVLRFLSCLYILAINPLLFTPFANVFSHSVDCLFILFMVPFAVQKVLGLIRSHLFFFTPITLADGSKKIIVVIYVRVFCQDVVHITQWNIIQSLNE